MLRVSSIIRLVSFELIVLDMMLQDKNGFDVLKDIRQRANSSSDIDR
jgi:DNA-binding response OmpR family regulator